MQTLEKHTTLKTAIGLTTITASVLISFSAILGRISVFLFFHHDLGSIADQAFKIATLLAEGWMWIPYLLLVGWYFKKDRPMIFLAFLYSTLLTQIPKLLIWPNITRPIASGIDPQLIHRVSGVDIHTLSSFPSGHTATAFTIFILTSYFFKNNWALLIGFFYALCAAYSRVYLAQHFPLDTAGGMLVAILSFYLTYYTKRKYFNA
jgi:membrane-associated phospholipid phosphatase